VGKVIAFRPTQKAVEAINEAMKKKGLSRTQAILHLIERETAKPQLKHPEDEREFFIYPPFLYCPDSTQWLSKDTLLDPQSDASCKKCERRKTCRAWG